MSRRDLFERRTTTGNPERTVVGDWGHCVRGSSQTPRSSSHRPETGQVPESVRPGPRRRSSGTDSDSTSPYRTPAGGSPTGGPGTRATSPECLLCDGTHITRYPRPVQGPHTRVTVSSTTGRVNGLGFGTTSTVRPLTVGWVEWGLGDQLNLGFDTGSGDLRCRTGGDPVPTLFV